MPWQRPHRWKTGGGGTRLRGRISSPRGSHAKRSALRGRGEALKTPGARWSSISWRCARSSGRPSWSWSACGSFSQGPAGLGQPSEHSRGSATGWWSGASKRGDTCPRSDSGASSLPCGRTGGVERGARRVLSSRGPRLAGWPPWAPRTWWGRTRPRGPTSTSRRGMPSSIPLGLTCGGVGRGRGTGGSPGRTSRSPRS